MKKFNLEDFKKGQLAITKEGEEAKFIGICETCAEECMLVVKLATDPYGTGYFLDGTYGTRVPSQRDLVRMKEMFDDWKRDDVIEISEDEVPKTILHFHSLDKDGTLVFYPYGKSSYTASLDYGDVEDLLRYSPCDFSYKRICSFPMERLKNSCR